YVHDVNGDGIPDLVVRYQSVLHVWYGKGNYQFARRSQPFILMETPVGPTVPLNAQSDLTFVDANHDGLTDLLLKQGNSLTLFVNTGEYFLKLYVPALDAFDSSTSRPVIADLLGTGNTEVVVTRVAIAKSLALDGPGTGLLRSADDGKGTVLSF